MKKEHSKKLNKIVILVIAIIMLCSFVMPKKIQAVTTESGGSFQEPFAKFMCFIPDVVNNLLQHTFISPDNIKNTNENGETKYSILYSPGIIFSGSVPAFDINFINREGLADEKTVFSSDKTYQQITNDISIEKLAENTARILSSTCTISNNNSENAEIEDEINRLCNRALSEDYINENIGGKEIEIYFSIYGQDWSIRCLVDNEIVFQKDSENGDTVEEAVNGDAGLKAVLKSVFRQTDENSENDKDAIEGLILEQKEYFENQIENTADTKIEKSIYFTHGCNNQTVEIKIEYNENSELKWTCYAEIATTASKTYKSSAAVLQPIVASWYKATRRIALVGLLSVLVYLGIRIVLSSTSAQDKAKYKKMLKNWIEAVCLLFMLHFIMSLIIILVTQINSIVGTSVMAPNGEDVLLSKLRNEIYDAGEWAQVISQVVIYTVITVYSIIFTIQYFRRTIYMAFLTAIAPLITLTYPIDKIKDSKAQAFDMWLKDYIFFSLLQVLHLLIYYIFVSQAISLSEVGTKWSLIYSIVAIGFLTQAEKIMKKMFGFQKSQSLGALAAGATGALIMNLFNKGSLRRPPKGPQSAGNAGGGSIRTRGGRNGTRIPSSNPLETLQTSMNEGGSQETPREQSSSGENVFEGSNEGTLPTPENNGPVSNTTPSSNSGSRSRRTGSSRRGTTPSTSSSQRRTTSSNETNNSSSSSQNSRPSNGKTEEELKAEEREQRRIARKRIRKGITALRKRYVGPALSRTGGIFLGGAGTLIGFSAGVAQGDIGKALTGAVAGGTAGYYGGQKLVNAGLDVLEAPKHIKDKVTEIEDTFNEGARGKEYVQNARFDRAFRESEDYRKLMEDNPKTPDEYIQKMLNAGITEKNRMDKILKKNKEDSDRYSIDRAIGYSALAKECPNSVLFNDKKFIKFCSDREIEITPEEAKAVRRVLIEFK